jgi:glycosyltransferase involved in cell wall biosynthesis
MIVRNEAAQIAKCLQSVLPLIQAYAIVDTGSEDDTVEIIQRTLADVPGRVLLSPWQANYSFHRNIALRLARDVAANTRVTHLLTLDADECLLQDGVSALKEIVHSNLDVVHWYAVDEDFRYLKHAVARLGHILCWKGALHETPVFTSVSAVSVLGGDCISYGHGGYRRRNQRSTRCDIDELTKTLISRQDDYRSNFYLARTFESENALVEASDQYFIASRLARREDDKFQSSWGALRCAQRMKLSDMEIATLAMEAAKASRYRRVEPLLALIQAAIKNAQLHHAAKLLHHAQTMSNRPVGTAMYDASAYGWKLLAMGAYLQRVLGRHRQSAVSLRAALRHHIADDSVRKKLKRELAMINR